MDQVEFTRMTEKGSIGLTGVSRRGLLGSLAATGVAGCLGLVSEDTADEPTFTSGDVPWEPGTHEIPSDGWPLPRRDARRSGVAPEPIGPEPPLESLWTVALDEGTSFRTPVVATGRVFAANQQGGVLLALDAETGEQLWKHVSEQWIRGSPVIADTSVYVKEGFSSNDQPNLLRALDAATGDQEWTYELATDEHRGSILCVSGGFVYVAANRHLLALDAETGEPAWRFDPGEPHRLLSSVAIGSEAVYASAHTTRTVHYEDEGGTVFALDPVEETIDWSVEFRQAINIALSRDVLLVRDIDELYALEAATGEQRWQTDLRPHRWDDFSYVPLFAVDEETVYHQATSEGDADGAAIAIVSLEDGSERTRLDLGYPDSNERTPLPTVAGNRLYTATAANPYNHWIDVIDLVTMDHLKTIKLEHPNLSLSNPGTPVVAEKKLFVTGGRGSEGLLFAFE